MSRVPEQSRPVTPEEVQQFSAKYASGARKREIRSFVKGAAKVGLLGVGLTVLQAVHISPEAVQNIVAAENAMFGVAVSALHVLHLPTDGLAEIPNITKSTIASVNAAVEPIHTFFESVGQSVRSHFPFTDALPNEAAKLVENTPLQGSIDRNIIADGEIIGAAAVIEGTRSAWSKVRKDKRFKGEENQIGISERGREIDYTKAEVKISPWQKFLGLTDSEKRAREAMVVSLPFLSEKAKARIKQSQELQLRVDIQQEAVADALEGKLSKRSIRNRYSQVIKDLEANGYSKNNAINFIKSNLLNIRRIAHATELSLVSLARADKNRLNLYGALFQLGGELPEQVLRFGAGAAVGHGLRTLFTSALGIVFWIPAAKHAYRIADEQGTTENRWIPKALLPFNFLPGIAAATGALANIPAEISAHNYDVDVSARMMLQIQAIASKPKEQRNPQENFILEITKYACRQQTMNDILGQLDTIKQDLTNPLTDTEHSQIETIRLQMQRPLQELDALKNSTWGKLFHRRKIKRLQQTIQSKQADMNKLLPEKVKLDNQIAAVEQQIVLDQQDLEKFDKQSLISRLLSPFTRSDLERAIEHNHKYMFSLMQDRYRVADQNLQVVDAMKVIKDEIGPIPSNEIIPTPQDPSWLQGILEQMF